MTSLSLVFELLAKDNASKAFRDVGDSVEDAGRKGEGFGASIGKGMGIAAGAIAAAGIGTALVGFVQDAAESAKISRLTEAAIKSTGGAANITAEQVGTLATSLSNKTAIDDEAIQSASNLLLTFTGVRNEAGKGNDIFDQATEAALNMSTAMGTDANTAALQLGKALNDPVKGMAALSKSGVSFTEQQKDQVKAMVAAGDTLGAQKIILGEMEKQFGGAAAAAADPLERLKVVAGNVGESIGGALLPFVERFATFLTDTALPALQNVGGFLKDTFGPAFSAVGDVFKVVTDALFKGEFNGGPFAEDSAFVNGLFSIRDLFVTVKDTVAGFFDTLKGGEGEGGGISGFLGRIGDAVGTLVPTIVEKIGGLARSFIDWIVPMIGPALEALGEFLQAFGTWIYGTALPWLVENLGAWAKAFIDWIGPMIPPLLEKLGDFLWSMVSWVIDTGLPMMVDNIKKWADALIDWIAPQIPGLLEKLGEFLSGAVTWIIGTGIPKMAGAMLTLAGELLGWVLPKLPGLLLNFGKLIAGVVGWLFTDAVPALAKGLGDLALKGITAFWEMIQNSALFTKLTEIFNGAVETVGKAWDAIQEAVKKPIRIVFEFVNDNMIDPINELLGLFPGGLKIPHLPKLAAGGPVRGPGTGTSDSVPALLSNGEYVINASAARALGRGALDRLNSGRLALLAKGGEVGGPLDWIGDAADWAGDMAAEGGRAVAGAVLNPLRDAAKSLIPGGNFMGDVLRGAVDKLVDAVLGKSDDVKAGESGPLGDGAAGGSWQALWAKVNAQFPSARRTSDFRPGDPGYHGKGKAIDVAGARSGDAAAMLAINRWAATTMGANLSQLIYTPGVNLLNGKPHTYNAATRADHFDHVHMATYDQGGWLKPGYTLAYNGTGRNESIRTADQEEALGAGTVFNVQITAAPTVPTEEQLVGVLRRSTLLAGGRR